MRWLCFCSLFMFCVLLVSFGQKALPLTQFAACAQFSDAVVRIEAGGQSRGTGFIVSPDGFVLTASHVVTNRTSGRYFSAITFQLPSGTEFATPAIPMNFDNVGQDFAVLKVEVKKPLPFLRLGSAQDVVVGADATIIGYPFSAVTLQGKNVFTKFCLSATFAGTEFATVPVTGTPTGTAITREVKVDVIYFQGPSVKGISGSPIVSRDTGRVVGIVTVKLSGIGQSLMELKDETAKGLGGGVAISGLEPGKAINQIITVLDDQLANGLGAATGIDDPKYALTHAQKKTKK